MQQIPLKLVLIVPFILQVVGAVGLVGYLSYRSSQNAVKNLAYQVMNQASERIGDRLNLVLQEQQRALAFNIQSIEQKTLEINNPEAVKQYLWQQINSSTFLTNNIIANDQGEEIAYIRFFSPEILQQAQKITGENLQLGEIALSIISQSHPNQRIYYLVDNQGRPRKTIYKMSIDTRTTSWYVAAKNRNKLSWSPIFTYRVIPSLGISIGRSMDNPEKKQQVILANSVALADLGLFLKELDFSPSGQAFILEPSGDLVATSTGELPFIRQPPQAPIRLHATKSQDPMTKVIATQLQQKYGNLSKIDQETFLRFPFENQKILVYAKPYRDKYGLNWLLLTAIPESDFMEEINQNTKITIFFCFLTLVFATGFGLMTAYWIAKPINQLSQASEAIAKGKWQTDNDQINQILSGQVITEIIIFAESFYSMASQLKIMFESLENRVKERTEELTIANQKLEFLVNIDGLTQIANRRCFDSYLSLEWQRHQRENIPLALLIIDIDYFKNYNDYYGHQQGDNCLIQVAKSLANIPQRATDLVARYGGEEFAIVLPHTDTQQALVLAESIRKAIVTLQIPHKGSSISDFVTLSIGVASLIPTPEHSFEKLIQQADEALYTAKFQGRNQAIAH
jgi:diguanylate cyclase (GGDEF)-like protein